MQHPKEEVIETKYLLKEVITTRASSHTRTEELDEAVKFSRECCVTPPLTQGSKLAEVSIIEVVTTHRVVWSASGEALEQLKGDSDNIAFNF